MIELDDTTIRNLYATREEIRAAGGECFPLQSHLGRMEEINKMVDTVVAKYGRIDILVNNAGASPAMKSVLDTDERLWETVMNLNLRGTYFTSQAVAKVMKAQGFNYITLDLQGYRTGSMNEPFETLGHLDSNGKTT